MALDFILNILSFLWDLFKEWIYIFFSPLKNLEILWIIIPTYISWLFCEFFQEKKKTDLGNAISNGGVALWVGIDWIRFLIREIADNNLEASWFLTLKFFLCLIIIAYGLFIIYLGIKGNNIISKIGRSREVTYLLIMFSPAIYGIIEITGKFIFAVILFFPLFYFTIELINKFLPDPKSISEKDDNKNDFSLRNDLNNLNSSFSSMNNQQNNFSMPQNNMMNNNRNNNQNNFNNGKFKF